jgi:hypothetical protein
MYEIYLYHRFDEWNFDNYGLYQGSINNLQGYVKCFIQNTHIEHKLDQELLDIDIEIK